MFKRSDGGVIYCEAGFSVEVQQDGPCERSVVYSEGDRAIYFDAVPDTFSSEGRSRVFEISTLRVIIPRNPQWWKPNEAGGVSEEDLERILGNIGAALEFDGQPTKFIRH